MRADELGVASDVFALGLIYTEYLTGAPPPFDPTYHEPAVAVRNGATLTIPRADIPAVLADVINQMLDPDPTARPTIAAIHAMLMTIRPPTAERTAASPSGLRGKGLGTALRARPTDPTPGTSSRLVGRLLRNVAGKGPS